MVGYDKNGSKISVKQPHHKSSSCPKWDDNCSWDNFYSSGNNPHILYGAIVGGPDQDGSFNDDRGDYVHVEVTTDYNAGFTSALAGLKQDVIGELF